MFLPTKNPPHKKQRDLAKEQDRERMISLAIEENTHFSVSTMEFERAGITYSIDTMEQLKKQHPDNKYFFIIGADSLFQLESWHRAESLLASTSFLVATRDEHPYEEMKHFSKQLTEKYKADISFLTTPNIEIAARALRERVKKGKSIAYYVPEKVREYIQFHRLYQEEKKI